MPSSDTIGRTLDTLVMTVSFVVNGVNFGSYYPVLNRFLLIQICFFYNKTYWDCIPDHFFRKLTPEIACYYDMKLVKILRNKNKFLGNWTRQISICKENHCRLLQIKGQIFLLHFKYNRVKLLLPRGFKIFSKTILNSVSLEYFYETIIVFLLMKHFGGLIISQRSLELSLKH